MGVATSHDAPAASSDAPLPAAVITSGDTPLREPVITSSDAPLREPVITSNDAAARGSAPPSAGLNGLNGNGAHAADGVHGDQAWARIVGAVKASQPALGAVLDHGMPLEVSKQSLRIGFPDGSFFGRQAQSVSAREAIVLAAEQVLGARPSLQIGSPGEAKISTLAQTEETARRTRNAARREAALRHPRVLDALEVFEESAGSVDVQVDLE